MPAIVKGGFWEANGVSNLTSIETTSALRRIASQALGKDQLYGLRAVWNSLTGAATGANATKTLTQVAATEDMSGVRAIDTVTLVNRNTTAADSTDIKADFLTLSSKTTFGNNPPPNLDGNPLGTR